jgi:hypothetical protein
MSSILWCNCIMPIKWVVDSVFFLLSDFPSIYIRPQRTWQRPLPPACSPPQCRIHHCRRLPRPPLDSWLTIPPHMHPNSERMMLHIHTPPTQQGWSHPLLPDIHTRPSPNLHWLQGEVRYIISPNKFKRECNDDNQRGLAVFIPNSII